MNNTIARFLKYFAVGLSTFLLDLLLLYVLTDLFFINYILSAGGAFLVAVSINYTLSRRFVFAQTTRPLSAGYYWFISIAGIGLVAVMSLMFLFVSIFNWHYLISRIFIAGIVGMWNYLMNLFFTFNVAGKH